MHGATIGEEVQFVGTLVKRTYKPGNRYVQLVFDAAGASRLSLSRNPGLVASLQVGERYKISGLLREVGQKFYVDDPTAIPLPYTSRRWQRLRLAGFAAVALLVVGGGMYAAAGPSGQHLTATPAAQQSSAASTQAPVQTSPTPPVTSVSPSVTSPAPATTPAQKKVTAKKPVVVTPSVTQAVVPVPIPTPINDTSTPNTPADPETPVDPIIPDPTSLLPGNTPQTP